MEIKPQDLRVGNKVSALTNNRISDTIMTITGIKQRTHEIEVVRDNNDTYIGWCFISMFCGIPLTPEWLERLGFRLVDETMASGVEGIKGPYYAKDALLLWSNGSEPKSAYLVFYADGSFGKYKAVRGRWIYSVHDLQNTYHAWKGEELAIDKTSLKN